jgi:hypothetical protein
VTGRKRHVGLLLCAILAGGLLVASPESARAEEPPAVPCPEFDGPPAADDEFTAYQYALACGVDVEVMSLRDVDRQVFATPEDEGRLKAQVAVEPTWVKNAAGAWVDIDPTLVARADGSAASAATLIGITAGAGGQSTFVTATDPGRGSLSLTWPLGALPTPVLNGSVATYPEVRPGMDLAVQAEAAGFSWVLVLKTPEAADDPILKEITIGIQPDGLSVVEDPETGRIDVVDGAGDVVFEAGQAIMWDSATAGASTSRATTAAEDPSQIGDVAVDVTRTGITLKPDVRMLADDSLTFPLYIDPPFTSTRKAWANVYAGSPSKGWTGDTSWPRSGGMRVGYNTWSDCGDGCGLWRSVITLNVGKLKGKYIDKAVVKALQTHTGGCGSYGLQLWRTKQISNGVSWNGVSWLYGSQLQTKDVPSSNAAGGCSGTTNEWVSFDGANIKKRVQSAADERNDTISFGFRSSSEGDRNAWRRIQTKSVRLEVTYYIYPPKPDQLAIDGDDCVTSPSATRWVTSRKPTMSLRAKSSESESVYVRMRIRKQGSDTDFASYRTPDAVAAYSPVSWPSTTSLPDGAYTYSALSEARQSSAVNSGWTDPCYFKVDATLPLQPTVTAPEGPYTEGQNVTFTLAASDPVVNGVSSGLRRYEYSWNSPTFRQWATPSSPTITRLASAGRHVLYVRAVDGAGNRSQTRVHTFFVGNDIVATPMGMWRFESEALDDSGLDHHLAMAKGSGPVYSPDGTGRSASALELDGGSCLTGKAPVRTDAALSLSLWVRMDAEPEAYAKILTQGNTEHSAYQIQYSAAANTWSFSLLNTPGTDADWISVSAVSPVALGQWLHIAAVYDPDGNRQRLYLNGSLAASQEVRFAPWNGKDTFSVGCLRSSGGGTGHFLDGAIDGLGIWQGVLSLAQIQQSMTDLPEGTELARWEFRNGGEDTSRYDHPIAIPGNVTAGYDRFNRPRGAVDLGGQSCLEQPDATVPVDRSWSVSTWVKIPEATGTHTLVSTMNDTATAGFELLARPTTTGGNLQFSVMTTNASGVRSGAAFGSVAPGGWHHVAAAFDLAAGVRRLYVDGELVVSYGWGNFAAPNAGHVLIGCTQRMYGETLRRTDYLKGSLQDVRLWRGPLDADDLAAMMGYPPPDLSGRWRLASGAGTDTSGRSHNAVLEGRTQVTDGARCEPDSAIELTGAGSLATTGPVVATDDSFTVSAWVRLSRLDTDMTVASAVGGQTTGFLLRYSASLRQFGFVMMNTDTADTSWLTAYGGAAPAVDTWYHLVGVYDIAGGKLHFYTSGQLITTRDGGPATPWNATGPLVIGATGTADGSRARRLQGAVDDVLVWQGALPAEAIADMSAAPIPMCVA